jgi:hypothetical protein
MTIAANTVLSLTLDSNLSYVSDTAVVPPMVSGNTLTWNFGDIAMSEGGAFNLQVSIPDDPLGTFYTSDLEITSDGPETDLDDNAMSFDIMVAVMTYLPMIIR